MQTEIDFLICFSVLSSLIKVIIMLTKARKYSISAIQDEVRALVDRGSISKQQKIYTLSRYFDGSEWREMEHILTQNEYLLRDSICDLISIESWLND